MNSYIKDRREEGFTLIELLIAIVVVGILTAVVIVGIGGLQDTGSKGACAASRDAAKAASVVHKANTSPSVYPTDFTSMITAGELDLGDATQTDATHLKGAGNWSLAITGGGATVPVLTCTP